MELLKFILIIVKRYPRKFLVTSFLSLIFNLVSMASVLSLAPMIDLITKPNLAAASPITLKLINIMEGFNLPTNIYSVLFVVFFFALAQVAISILVFSSIQKIKYSLLRDMICNSYEKFFKAGWGFFVLNSQGVLGNTFIKEISTVGESFGNIATMIVIGFQVVFYFIVAFFVSWKLSLALLLLISIVAGPFLFLGRLTYRFGRISLQTSNEIFKIIHEDLSAAKLIIGFGAQKKAVSILDRVLNKHISATLKNRIISNSTPTLFQPLGLGILIVCFFLSKTVIEISLSELVVVLYSFYVSFPIIGQAVTMKNSLLNFFPSFEQLNKLNLMAEEITQPTGEIIFQQFKERIIFENIEFGYFGHEPVLRNINVTIPKGKMIAFVGKSGIGKTTLIDLLMRFYDPTAGKISVDNNDLKDLDIASWRKKIGYVPQESFLFNTTLYENLKWAKDDAAEDQIAYACKMANVDEFINDLPDGMNTIVGDRGVRLSGGQRQRVALARAILRKPELLILDEATSSLDSRSERLIQESIEKMSHETTVVIIAHRLSTIGNADYIYFMDEKGIAEEGTFTDLYAKKGKYFELAKIQGMT